MGQPMALVRGSLTGRPVLRVVTGAFAEEDLLSHGLTAYPPD